MEDGNEDQRMLTASDSVEPSVSSAADEVKKYSVQQREALPGEPRCIECGRYGEYICDETDDDICSLECKQKLLLRTKQPKPPTSLMLPPVRLPATDECFYVRDGNGKSEGRSLTTDQTELIRVKFEIVVKGNCVPAPVLSFAHCNLPQKLLQNIESAGYEILTPVQMQAIPAALSRQSLLVSAETGSGKTASYLVPTVSYCANFRKESSVDQKKPLVMVLTPTRELCIQVEEQAKVLGKGLPFKTALVVGGDAMPRQIHRIQGGIEMIIGTPGRLIDLLTKFEIELDSLNKPNQAVKQVAIWVESKHKKQKLFDIFNSRQHFKPPVIVFVGSRLGADLLSDAITIYTGLKTSAIHGEKSMKERRGILSSFLLGELPVIVATGILGRGIDLLHVRQVIVFDMPNSVKEYVHQIGRASRMGEEGNSILFVNEENKKLFPELIGILRSSGAAIPREITNSRYLAASLPSDRGNRKRKPYV
ncbi:DNA/RNA helicase, DEAD/DEAH box type, N-terminal [Cynara cardunculus var. scolymus]|uniref:DNA/RNA helicase, DEAD/DEAH box type, N-terminal n=1 Tax=Cynara cardunculus var. scolymus TaxID=59895 RepID=A0A118K5P7_CYNCS|nr:DNA/RNA helicase, DEAD/DEAH box type, N-terminal [Cynara cardunculus var. scolymus]